MVSERRKMSEDIRYTSAIAHPPAIRMSHRLPFPPRRPRPSPHRREQPSLMKSRHIPHGAAPSSLRHMRAVGGCVAVQAFTSYERRTQCYSVAERLIYKRG